MKKTIALFVTVIIIIVASAGAELTFLARFRDQLSQTALEAADKAKLPTEIQSESLTQLERELFELGYAMGYDAALTPKVTYVVNTSSMKFHLPDCLGVRNMNEKNKMEVTSTRDELINEGYKPCGTCNP